MKSLKPLAFLLIMALTLLVPTEALAHSALVSTTPGAKSTTEVSELTLTFNESIEPASGVKVTNEANEEQAVKETTVKGKVMTVLLEKPLNNGVYTVDWKIISKDGHPLKGAYTIEVSLPAPSPSTTPEPPEAAASSEPSPSASLAPETTVPTTEPIQDEAGQAEDSSSFDLSKWLLIGAAGLLVIAVAASMLKKKK